MVCTSILSHFQSSKLNYVIDKYLCRFAFPKLYTLAETLDWL